MTSPCLAAFERGDELALWTWMYRVWNGWKPPRAKRPMTGDRVIAMALPTPEACRTFHGIECGVAGCAGRSWRGAR